MRLMYFALTSDIAPVWQLLGGDVCALSDCIPGLLLDIINIHFPTDLFTLNKNNCNKCL